MTNSMTLCIHGFTPVQCVSCRECEHGQIVSTCQKCRAVTPTRKVPPADIADRPTEEHAGYEIFYEPAVSGWRYRASDSAASPLSYRSAFLARKAVDGLNGHDADEPKPNGKAKRRKG